MPPTKTNTVSVHYNGVLCGTLSKSGKHYRFQYDGLYLNHANSRPVSVTLALRKEPYESNYLFPAFINMLSEGANKRMQCRMMKIDEDDYFGLLMATGIRDGIGPITLHTNDATT